MTVEPVKEEVKGVPRTPVLKIETANGIYEVKRPGGRLGAKSMMILSKMSSVEGIKKVPKKLEDGSYEGNEDPLLVDRIVAENNRLATVAMGDVFEEWAPLVLPHTVIAGPFTYEDMPGEDQLALFMALSQETKIGDEFFRILPK